MPSPDELADALASRIEGATGSDYGRSIRTLAREAAKQALLDEANRLESFVSGYTSETPQTRAGRDVIAQIRTRAEQIGEAEV